MKNALTHSGATPRLVLLAVLAATLVGVPTASAVPAGNTGADVRLPASGEAAAAGQVPTLTNDVGQPPRGAERQRGLGVGLLAIGLLGLVIGLAARGTPYLAPGYRGPRRGSGGVTQNTR